MADTQKPTDTSAKPINMGPFGNDEEVAKLVKYGLDYDRQRLIAAGKIPPTPPPKNPEKP